MIFNLVATGTGCGFELRESVYFDAFFLSYDGYFPYFMVKTIEKTFSKLTNNEKQSLVAALIGLSTKKGHFHETFPIVLQPVLLCALVL